MIFKANKYRAAMYIRLSKEDSDTKESNSVTNQRDLILSFLKSHPEIEVENQYIDDGYSGVSFDRPRLNDMISDIKSGKIDCVIVKDLSRLGRNYVESGRYIKEIFRFLNVRFIAINDNHDSLFAKDNDIIVPFKNLMNDSYSRDISIKVRSQLTIRRERGDFVGSFPVFGYVKNPENKHELLIDEMSAGTVQRIFKMKVDGYNNQAIADYLNQNGILSPLEYKNLQNWAFSTSFKLNPQAKWSAVGVNRILQNEIYTGTMVQGKESTPSYKIKQRVKKSKDEWVRVENTHEPIIKKEDFVLVQKILQIDTRTSPENKSLYLFSGMLVCGECGGNLIRKLIKKSGNDYVYYICGNNKKDKNLCSHAHRISEQQLIDCTLTTLQQYIRASLKIDEISSFIAALPLAEVEIKNIIAQIDAKQIELSKNKGLKHSLYEDYKIGILTKEDYLEMKSDYEQLCLAAQNSISSLENEKEILLQNSGTHSIWVESFRENLGLTQLTRKAVVTMINKIIIINKKHIKIEFNYKNEYKKTVTPAQST